MRDELRAAWAKYRKQLANGNVTQAILDRNDAVILDFIASADFPDAPAAKPGRERIDTGEKVNIKQIDVQMGAGVGSVESVITFSNGHKIVGGLVNELDMKRMSDHFYARSRFAVVLERVDD